MTEQTHVTSVRITAEEKALFLRAMEAESLTRLSSWIVRAARIHAQNVLRESEQVGESLENKLRDIIREELSKSDEATD